MKLIICAGTRLKPGWTSHDVQGEVDIQCNFWDLPKHVKDNSVEEAEFTHALEHFPMAKTTEVLALIYRLMAPNGKLYIEVPNFAWHAEEILINPKNRQVVQYAFGGQLDEYDFHFNGFTPQILAEDLRNAGFEVDSLRPNSSIECEARKC